MATKSAPPWTQIEAEYLAGATPKDLAAKYGTTARKITVRARDNKWKQKKTSLRIKAEISIEQQLEAVHATAVKVGQQILGKIAKGVPLTADERIIAITVTGKAWSELKASERKVSRENLTAMPDEAVNEEIESLLNG